MIIIGEHTHNFTARLIQFWMFVHAVLHLKMPTVTYNHMAIYDDREGIVYEAVSKRVIGISLADHEKHHPDKMTKELKLNLTLRQEYRMREYLKKQVGKKYEYSNFLWHVIYTLTGVWFGSQTDKRLYCYELGIRAMNASGAYNLPKFLNPFEFWQRMKQITK